MTRKLPSGCTFVSAQGPCPEFATFRGRCDEHKRKSWNHGGKTREQRGYDFGWRKVRDFRLKRNPICQHPECTERATEVDHIIPIGEGGSRLDLLNTQSLCTRHHAEKTKAEALRARRRNSVSRYA